VSIIATVLAALQLALLAALTVFGLHRGLLMILAWRRSRGTLHPRTLPPAVDDDRDLPSVTVQLPLYNERAVVARLVRAVAALDYPRDRLQIQVLDDSTDDTSEILIATLESPLHPGLDIARIRRRDRTGFKAGALRHGLHDAGEHTAKGDLIAMFDADFVPPSDFLRRAVAPFADPGVGMVQARWDHLDAEYGLLTRLQAILLDGHFAVEHVARAGGNHFFNFNGTAGIFRRATIEDAGGWQDDTLTEDMDLSYRAQLKGWRFVYLPGLTCPAELPVEPAAFLTQQYRWAKGGIQTARKTLPVLWRAPIPRSTRREAVFHLLGNLAFPLLLLLVLIALPLQVLRAAGTPPLGDHWGFVEGGPLLFGTLCVMAYYAYGQVVLRRFDATTWILLPGVVAVGAGLAVNNTAAVFAGFGSRTGAFRRTPKHAVIHKQRGDGSSRRYRSPRGLLPLLELLAGAAAATTSWLGVHNGLPGTALFHGLFAVGLIGLGAGSLFEGSAAARHTRDVAGTAAAPRTAGTPRTGGA